MGDGYYRYLMIGKPFELGLFTDRFPDAQQEHINRFGRDLGDCYADSAFWLMMEDDLGLVYDSVGTERLREQPCVRNWLEPYYRVAKRKEDPEGDGRIHCIYSSNMDRVNVGIAPSLILPSKKIAMPKVGSSFEEQFTIEQLTEIYNEVRACIPDASLYVTNTEVR